MSDKSQSGQGSLAGWAAEAMRHTWGTDVTGFDPAFVDRVRGGARKVFGPGKYLGVSIRGLELIPASQQVMLVSNHSGGTTTPDVWGLALAWYEHFGTARPLHILAHELLFALPQTARIFERLGVLRASSSAARNVLASGRDVLVYPGGDVEVWRPYTQRYQLNFAGRTGYARLALEMNVPIVPVAHAGAHDTLRVLTSGNWIARKLGLRRFARAEIWPIHLSLPWGVAFGPVPHIPWPAELRYLVGQPIPLPESTHNRATELDLRVRGAVQAQLEALRQEELHRKGKRELKRDLKRD
ncbi:MAG: putative acyltransferase [Myxococcaceae bacterium]|nr:putative acyltransferase [Myxococcaceae bacterium]